MKSYPFIHSFICSDQSLQMNICQSIVWFLISAECNFVKIMYTLKQRIEIILVTVVVLNKQGANRVVSRYNAADRV